MRAAIARASLVTAALLAGCAGFRGGWESVPFVGDVPPAYTKALTAKEVRDRSTLALPGITLEVSLDNRLRTRDTKIYFGLPLSIDPRRTYPENHEPGKTRVFVTATPEDAGFVFRPKLATLRVGERTHRAGRGFEFATWDSLGRQVAAGGKWDRRDVGEELALAGGGRHHLSLTFDLPVPSPETPDIVLELAEALRDEALAPLPPIRFAPVKWSEGYQ